MHESFRRFWTWLGPVLVPLLLVVLGVVTLREPVASWLQGEEKYDQDALREWVREAKVYETLPKLVSDYLALEKRHRHLGQLVKDQRATALEIDEFHGSEEKILLKREELQVHLKAMCEPATKVYPGRLPLFPVIYQMRVAFRDDLRIEPLIWDSGRPRQAQQYRELPSVALGGGEAWVDLQYQVRVYARQQFNQRETVAKWFQLSGLAILVTLGAILWIFRAQRRQYERERQRVRQEQQVNEAERLRLGEELRRQEAERQREEAERAALELKSQLFASIGIMAGSYAHNIKNLLVRPNDLLNRCLEADGLSGDQQHMLGEVRQTLGTVTERLQQILQTIRRDPSQSERSRLDLNELARDMQRTWEDLGREKWKLTLSVDLATGPLWIEGDPSHLQQALENLLFNARDATFEMRNRLREQARHDVKSDENKKQALITAAGWRGRVVLRTRRRDGQVVLEIEDNGVGLTEEVRRRCTETHFSTKRNNALFAGLSAGMGLGLSFVAVILERDGARLEIESQLLKGATFRVVLPAAS